MNSLVTGEMMEWVKFEIRLSICRYSAADEVSIEAPLLIDFRFQASTALGTPVLKSPFRN
jgi:hypothetical protein